MQKLMPQVVLNGMTSQLIFKRIFPVESFLFFCYSKFPLFLSDLTLVIDKFIKGFC